MITHTHNQAWVCFYIAAHRGYMWLILDQTSSRPLTLCVWVQIWSGISAVIWSGLLLRVTECNPHCLTRPAQTHRPLMSDWLPETEQRPISELCCHLWLFESNIATRSYTSMKINRIYLILNVPRIIFFWLKE